jgi:hypothetical protein
MAYVWVDECEVAEEQDADDPAARTLVHRYPAVPALDNARHRRKVQPAIDL